MREETRGPKPKLADPPPPPSHLAHVDNQVLVVFRAEKNSQHPISNQQKTAQPVTVDYPPKPPPPPPPHHMLVFSTTLFTFLLANYLPLSPVCLGAGALSNRGNLSHSLIERLSGDYGEVRNRVVFEKS